MNRGEDAAGEAVSSFRFPKFSEKTGEVRRLWRPGRGVLCGCQGRRTAKQEIKGGRRDKTGLTRAVRLR